jgi:phage gp29-like protein
VTSSIVVRQRPFDGTLWYRANAGLQDRWTETPNPLLEQTRQYYGRALTPATIEAVLYAADHGHMRDATDLVYETLRMDPFFGSITGKRLRGAAAIRPKVMPAEGDGLDPELAAAYADVVRQQIAKVPNWRQVLLRLNWGHCHGRAAAEKVWAEIRASERSAAATEAATTATSGRKLERPKWRIDRINWIHPRRLSLGPERELRVRDDAWSGLGFERRGLELREYPLKFMHFMPQLYDEYAEREGFGQRGCYFAFFKRFGYRERLVLVEVYGRPWRNIEVDPAYQGVGVDKEKLDAAAQSIDETAGNATQVVPPGMKLNTEQPGQNAGQGHRELTQDCNDELAILVLGEVRTSDAKPGAIGSQGEEVALALQGEVKAADAWNLSDLLTEQLSADIIGLNYGEEALPYTPRIELPYEMPPDRTVEIERTSKAFSIGLPLKEEEVYERIGFSKPQPGDRVVQSAPAPAGMPGMGAPSSGGATVSTMQSEDEETEPDAGVDPTRTPSDDELADAVAEASDLLASARAAHVLTLVQQIGRPAPRTQRRRLPKPPKTEA